MKKNILLGWAVALAALLTGACTQQPLPSTETQPGTGTMIVRPLLQGDLSTRSGEAYTGELASEKAISNIQVLTFDKTTGHLEFYHTYTVTTEVQEFALRAGTYRIWAVANGPDLTGISTETALKQLIIDLGTYNDPASDFIMAGSELSTVIAGDTAECLIYLTRLVSRVSLGDAVLLSIRTRPLVDVGLQRLLDNLEALLDKEFVSWVNEVKNFSR